MALLRPQLGGRTGSGAPSPAPVSGLVAGQIDWDVVDEELYHIPAEYKDQRFDSLKHVLTVLGAVDSEGALEEVRLYYQPTYCFSVSYMHCQARESHCFRGETHVGISSALWPRALMPSPRQHQCSACIG